MGLLRGTRQEYCSLRTVSVQGSIASIMMSLALWIVDEPLGPLSISQTPPHEPHWVNCALMYFLAYINWRPEETFIPFWWRHSSELVSLRRFPGTTFGSLWAKSHKRRLPLSLRVRNYVYVYTVVFKSLECKHDLLALQKDHKDSPQNLSAAAGDWDVKGEILPVKTIRRIPTELSRVILKFSVVR